jgi:hypothetical protein
MPLELTRCLQDIFDKPQFFIQGPTAGDVIQGNDGDCYLMAALCGLGNMKGLIDKVCVIHDAAVGVYGFVFFRGNQHVYYPILAPDLTNVTQMANGSSA